MPDLGISRAGTLELPAALQWLVHPQIAHHQVVAAFREKRRPVVPR